MYYKFKNLDSKVIHGFAPIYDDNSTWQSLCGLKMKITNKKWEPSHDKCNCKNCLIEYKRIDHEDY